MLVTRQRYLIADFTGEHGIDVVGVAVVLVGSGGSTAAGSAAGRAVGGVSRLPRDDLLLRDDVGVVLRLLHVRRHVCQRTERLAAPHALQISPTSTFNIVSRIRTPVQSVSMWSHFDAFRTSQID